MNATSSPTTSLPTPSARPLLVVVVLWFVVTLGVVLSGVLANVPAPAPALAVLLAGGVLLAYAALPGFRTRLNAIPLGLLVGWHLLRIVAGGNFLRLHAQGVLPADFALPAGIGDVAVGIGALLMLVIALPVRKPWQRTTLLVWNVLGLVDILAVLGNGARYAVSQPDLVVPFTKLPLAMLPLFVVPLVIVAHVLVFVRLRRNALPAPS
ncbi:MAG: hypothetical protein AAF624_17895 [Bacteroidota bacterium]